MGANFLASADLRCVIHDSGLYVNVRRQGIVHMWYDLELRSKCIFQIQYYEDTILCMLFPINSLYLAI